jgi:hypothetical protein
MTDGPAASDCHHEFSACGDVPDAATTLAATLPRGLPIQDPVREQPGPRLRGGDPVAILNPRPVSRSAAMNGEATREFLRRGPFELSSRRMP